METIRLIDADPDALAERAEKAAAEAGARPGDTEHFTYWYTGRPPVHEAVVRLPAPAAQRRAA